MSSKRIMDIELLRAIAVIGVLFHHIQSMPLPGGMPRLAATADIFQLWWGVDLFFAISGFVIGRNLIPQLRRCDTPRQFWATTREFWIRRAFRLLPSAWLWLLLVLFAVFFFNRSGAFGSIEANLQATLAGFLQFANVRFGDAFMRYEYGASFVYWTLSLEEQFYLILPLLVFVTRRYLVWVLLAVVLLQFFTMRGLWLMVFRTDALALGVLLSVWSLRSDYERFEPKWLRRSGLGALLIMGLGGVMAVIATEHFNFSFYRIGVIALLSAVLVWVASYDRDYLLPPSPVKTALTWVGSRSYGIYLIHIPVFFLLRELWFRFSPLGSPDMASHPWLALACGLSLIGLLSELNYRLVEMPLRARGAQLVQRLSANRTVLPASGAPSC
ncbi:Peptidoglycan/LPS O-acetylase OafA/YrhL, contains acyltransferase and SGNH-hydrolase domains [Pseudomonas sp. NFACC23-1]|uniref:acyltransferase family protein n=1 Tax=unclassified Pseudomonas TaxID=196821 RepID=UPI0008801A31|nr:MULTISPECIES: acyltransferase [unclassified Pseudomonas]SDB22097.1 Peptidoglycan/LPS O-acetylase OafA/YrhL, contains acyltransferase and SGNH-hydrolase domains [Pseudomonas sp. NFACC17-2]SEJ31336.1 Peptidoglycan/LPS O-acetylase OafA/YrhL, contains acyltransferase and SGNH-hydrolase domains [Pseudomonas sp. NFACC23-1]SFW63658.1 Peptidoglycan/LPS O-acetylase OafA/YrhL, contains acyltransferase and SGNH-hydrolase domains [Pseudomonas sp. NFACC16-2]